MEFSGPDGEREGVASEVASGVHWEKEKRSPKPGGGPEALAAAARA
jgi:hypothetical protein